MDVPALVALGLGAVALLFGYRLLWLAVAFAGAWGTLTLLDAHGLADGWAEPTRWLVAAVVGLLLALLTRTAVIGFVLAAAVVGPMLEGLGLIADTGEAAGTVATLVAGAIGAVIASLAFKGAVVGLTSAVGAGAIMTEGLGAYTEGLEPIWFLAGLVVLAVGGALHQFRTT